MERNHAPKIIIKSPEQLRNIRLQENITDSGKNEGNGTEKFSLFGEGESYIYQKDCYMLFSRQKKMDGFGFGIPYGGILANSS